jgi:anthranilate phosphoribosyltransferase
LVVHGAGGIDELSPAGPNVVFEVSDGEVRERRVDPLEIGVRRCAPGDLRGGSPAENGAAIRAIFDGAPGPKRDAVLLNASGALFVAGVVDDFADGFGVAAGVVDSGAAGERLDALITYSQEAGTRGEPARAS